MRNGEEQSTDLNLTFNDSFKFPCYQTIDDRRPKNTKIILYHSIRKFKAGRRIIEVYRNAENMCTVMVTISEAETGTTYNIPFNCTLLISQTVFRGIQG